MSDSRCYCGTPEPVGEAPLRRAPHCRWFVGGTLPGVGDGELRRHVALAFARWSAVCAVSAEEVAAPEGADLLVQTGRIDRSGGVLAWCELPGPPVQRMMLDTSEAWVLDGAGMPARGGIRLLNVLAHELGHMWGWSHHGRGLMKPTYDPAFDRPQADDIARAVADYGPPVASPPPPDDPLATGYWVLLGPDRRPVRAYRVHEVPLAEVGL